MTWRLGGTRVVWVLMIAMATGLFALSGCSTGAGGGAGGKWRQGASAAGRNDIATSSDDSEVRKRARIRLELATTYFAQGQYTTALDEAKQALGIDPTLAAVVELRALIYDAMGDQARADESFKQALSMEPHNASVLHNFAWSQCRRKAYARADALFDQAVKVPLAPTVPQSWLARGVCQIQAGQWSEAEVSLSRSYELDPSNPATTYNLAAALYHRGEFERARYYVRRVNVVATQVNAESLWLAARVEHKLGNPAGRDELGAQLRSRHAGSREATMFELGRFDD